MSRHQRRLENEYETYTGTFENSNYGDNPTPTPTPTPNPNPRHFPNAETLLQRRIYILGILLVVTLILALSSLIYATVTVPKLLYELEKAEDDIVQIRDGAKEYVSAAYKLMGWERSGTYLYKVFESEVQYEKAEIRCESFGGRLIAQTLRDSSAIQDIVDKGFVRNGSSPYTPWIGFDDRVTEGDWKWSDGGETNETTTAWYGGRPMGEEGQNCGSFYAFDGNTKALINDLECEYDLHYICEVEEPEFFVGNIA